MPEHDAASCCTRKPGLSRAFPGRNAAARGSAAEFLALDAAEGLACGATVGVGVG